MWSPENWIFYFTIVYHLLYFFQIFSQNTYKRKWEKHQKKIASRRSRVSWVREVHSDGFIVDSAQSLEGFRVWPARLVQEPRRRGPCAGLGSDGEERLLLVVPGLRRSSPAVLHPIKKPSLRLTSTSSTRLAEFWAPGSHLPKLSWLP